ncbi:hypothetical protein ACFQE1_02425 [Halobium palmae]|uniref:Polyketide cyclase / dehydrase and lipid transport n=1 Tax=Halobium palmae TaxID=1776492 RepID=A0ABD5RVU3_9EURY
MLVVSIFLGTYLATSLLPAVVVAAILLVVARAPILESKGTVRLRTDDDPEAVVDDFAGPTPPVLAFQWGVADEVTTGEDSATYHVSYLFGLRSADVTAHYQTESTGDGKHRVELEVTMNDEPWATYTSIVEGNDDQTIVDVEYVSNRRFGLRRIPQQFFTERYRDKALSAQGYTVVERDSHFGL